MRREAEIGRAKLPAETVKKALRDCAESGIEAVSFTGGEPFINIPEILGLLDYAGGLKIPYLRSGTNGYMFAPGGEAAGLWYFGTGKPERHTGEGFPWGKFP
jgi:molybdenum cofactor biosynthesis enzyme MoaA